MKRREFMKTVALTGMAAVCALHTRTSLAKEPAKPDMLLIMPDQMRGDCLSILNHPVVQTPFLDELAGQGALFRRAYTTVASCIPARYSLLTGLYPQTSGVVGFKVKPFSTPSLPGLLSKAGYATVLVGRNMHQAKESGDCGYEKSILGSTYISNDAYDTFLRKAAPDTGGIRAVVEKTGVTYNHWQAKPWPLAKALHPTEWVIAESRQTLQQADPNKPLFLTTSFYAPHPPLFPPKTYFDRYAGKKLPSPAQGDWVDWKTLSTQGDRSGHRVLLTGKTLQATQAGYFGLIEHIDQQVSHLIRDFKNRSEKAGRPWIIVVTSDHGEMLGDHGYFRKCEPYEGSANIPFIISGSRSLGFQPGLRIKQPVCLEDVMPTLLALAGTQSPAHVDGIDLVPTLRGQTPVIRPWLHFEHAPCYSKAQAYHALTDGTTKYIWRPTSGEEQLFDLDLDPREERDLSKNATSQERLRRWRGHLIKRLEGRPEGFSQKGKLIAGQPYPPLNRGTSGTGHGGTTQNSH